MKLKVNQDIVLTVHLKLSQRKDLYIYSPKPSSEGRGLWWGFFFEIRVRHRVGVKISLAITSLSHPGNRIRHRSWIVKESIMCKGSHCWGIFQMLQKCRGQRLYHFLENNEPNAHVAIKLIPEGFACLSLDCTSNQGRRIQIYETQTAHLQRRAFTYSSQVAVMVGNKEQHNPPCIMCDTK